MEEERSLTHQLVTELLEKSQSPELQIVVCALENVWKSIDLEIKKIELKLKEQAQQDENESTYRSAPGIGFLAARVLSNELGNMSQFDNERQLFSYTGLTPSEYKARRDNL